MKRREDEAELVFAHDDLRSSCPICGAPEGEECIEFNPRKKGRPARRPKPHPERRRGTTT